MTTETTKPLAVRVEPSVRPLVERLRDGTYYGVQDLFDEAADEIQRLRGIVPEALEKLKDELCAENERLRGCLLWLLWHHQGGHSPTGQPIRRALGIGQHDPMTSEQIEEGQRFGTAA